MTRCFLSWRAVPVRDAPQSGEIIGILKQLMDEMSEDLPAVQKEDEDRKANHVDSLQRRRRKWPV